jgi:hypothetical protein
MSKEIAILMHVVGCGHLRYEVGATIYCTIQALPAKLGACTRLHRKPLSKTTVWGCAKPAALPHYACPKQAADDQQEADGHQVALLRWLSQLRQVSVFQKRSLKQQLSLTLPNYPQCHLPRYIFVFLS